MSRTETHCHHSETSPEWADLLQRKSASHAIGIAPWKECVRPFSCHHQKSSGTSSSLLLPLYPYTSLRRGCETGHHQLVQTFPNPDEVESLWCIRPYIQLLVRIRSAFSFSLRCNMNIADSLNELEWKCVEIPAINDAVAGFSMKGTKKVLHVPG